MKLIVAGSRTFIDYQLLKSILDNVKTPITEIVCGTKPPHWIKIEYVTKGADQLGYRYAVENKIPVKLFLAEWDNIYKENAVIKTNSQNKKYNAIAGLERNEEMAKYADACIAFWDGESRGTKHMIDLCQKYNIKCKIIMYEEN